METEAPDRTMIPASPAKGEGPPVQLQRVDATRIIAVIFELDRGGPVSALRE
jgi:hypothetical protein